MDKFKDYQSIAASTGRSTIAPTGFSNKIKELVQKNLGKLSDWINKVVEALHDIDSRLTELEESFDILTGVDPIEEVETTENESEQDDYDPLQNPLG